jgi:hypothetical protein
MTDAPREITVEILDYFDGQIAHAFEYQELVDVDPANLRLLVGYARSALSQAGGEREQMLIGLLGRWLRHADSGHWRDGTHLSLKATTTADDTRAILAPDTPQSVPTCTCSKHPLWDGYDGDCPIHGWFEPVAPDTPQSVPAEIESTASYNRRMRELELAIERHNQPQGEEIVPCMDDWCKISPCKCRDGINALIAERDEAKADALHAADIIKGYHDDMFKLVAERDKLKLDWAEDANHSIACLEALEAERDKLKEACDGYLAHAANLRGENAKLEERVSVLEGALESIALRDSFLGELQEPQAARIARAALTRTSEDA